MSRKNIFSLDVNEIQNLIDSNEITVCVIGIGRIGLPTALSFANSNLNTIGVDINTELVNRINSGDFPLKDEPGYEEMFDSVMKREKFVATTKIDDAVPKSDIILLSLPTPMDENNVPDYSALRTVGKQLHEIMETNSVVIIESTIEPGFVENEFVKILEGDAKKLIAGKNFGMGVCPETANPGEIMHDFEKLPRLVGAVDEKTTDIIMKIYDHVFPVDKIKMPNCKTANAVKLTTNIFRDVNIAFINEFALLFEKLGIDIFKVLEAADKKYNFQIHFPGAGVGGPCLPVNSYQMLNTAKNVDSELLKIVRIGRQVNEKMPAHIVDLTIDGLKQAGKTIDTSTILILGVSYKPEVKDIQLSPAEHIIKKLQSLGADVKIYDPFFKNNNVFGIKTENEIANSLSETDAIVIVTAHKEFQSLEPSFLASNMKTPVVIDSRGVFDIITAKEAGLIFRGLGRGKF